MKETRLFRPCRLPGVANPAHRKMMAGCWLEECKREGKIVVANDGGDDKNDGRILKPQRESGIYFLKTTLDMSGDQLVNNILSDDPSL